MQLTKSLRDYKTWFWMCSILWIGVLLVWFRPNMFVAHATTPASVVRYTVQNGDTLWTIAEKYGQGEDVRRYVQNIQQVNRVSSPADIKEGQILMLPQK